MDGSVASKERNRGVALWRQIQEQLTEEIRSGRHAPGSRLPTEPELAERFGVNRHTLRRAMAALAEDGLVRIEQGRGTFVQEHVLDYFIGRRTRWSENVLRQKREPGGRLIRAFDMPADTTIVQNLGVRPGARCICLETVMEADGRPMSLSCNYFPAERFPEMIPFYAATGSITKALQRSGLQDYLRQVSRITARMPTADEARYLRQPRTRPVLVSEYVNVDPDGVPIQYAITRFASDRVQLVLESDGGSA